MRKKIYQNTSILLGFTVVLSFVVILWVYYGQFSRQVEIGIKNEAQYIKTAIEDIGVSYLTEEVGNATSTRLSLIGADGEVLYDSVKDSQTMENHANRPEIKEAIQKGFGESRRLSTTLGEQTFYYALRINDGSVIRVAFVTDSIFMTFTSSILIIVLLMLVVLGIALFLSNIQIKKLVKPINNLNLEQPLENEVYEELTPLLRRINKQNQLIKEQVKKLKTYHEEYMAITENMKDGMIITNQSVVLGMNKAALDMFQVTSEECVHKNIITVSRSMVLKEAVDKALRGDPNENIIELNGKIFQLLANPVTIHDSHMGAVILLLDVTEKQKVENLRREFSANVSHELKTPLMSISGYAELIKNHMVKEADIPEFASRIYSEATRLTTLVEDIIKLSRLDEKHHQMKKEMVDLNALTTEVCTSLQIQANKRGITLELEGQPARLLGVKQVLYEMIFNLVDNAIKYNNTNGKVEVVIKNLGNNIEWEVKDNGIGIPEEEHDRIFERFYRVDKSHSRETGGTGLGLSIVKHGAILHNGTVKVQSKLGKGTTITIEFPSR